MLNKILTVVNIILAAILVYILIQPKIQASKIVEAKIYYRDDVSATPLYIAEANGYFDSLKVKVTVEEIGKPGEDVENVLKGIGQLASGTDWGMFLFKAKARPGVYRIVANATSTISVPYTALLAPPKSKIKKLSDLVGKKVGYLRGTKYEYLLRYALRSQGINDSLVEYTPLMMSEMKNVFNPDSALVAVDAVLAVEPYRTLLIKQGARIIEDGFLEKYTVTPFPVGVTYTSVTNLQLRKNATQRVVKAINMAIDFMRKHPDSATAIVKTKLNVPEEVSLMLPTFEKYNEIDPAQLDRYVDVLKKANVLFVDIETDSMMLSPEEIKK